MDGMELCEERSLMMLVPSRGRPETVAEVHEAFESTSVATTASSLAFVVDRDDPALDDYLKAVDDLTDGWLLALVVEGGTMVKALNGAVATVLDWPAPPWALGFMGDDHRPRTKGWDQCYLDELFRLADRPGGDRGVGFVYGDDTIQGPNIPTQIAMTAETVRRLGWMAPGTFRHLWVDNVWLELGRATNRISYLPDVTVEHLHPVKTGEWTEGHIRVNSGEINAHDAVEFKRWLVGTGPDDKPAVVGRLMGMTG